MEALYFNLDDDEDGDECEIEDEDGQAALMDVDEDGEDENNDDYMDVDGVDDNDDYMDVDGDRFRMTTTTAGHSGTSASTYANAANDEDVEDDDVAKTKSAPAGAAGPAALPTVEGEGKEATRWPTTLVTSEGDVVKIKKKSVKKRGSQNSLMVPSMSIERMSVSDAEVIAAGGGGSRMSPGSQKRKLNKRRKSQFDDVKALADQAGYGGYGSGHGTNILEDGVSGMPLSDSEAYAGDGSARNSTGNRGAKGSMARAGALSMKLSTLMRHYTPSDKKSAVDHAALFEEQEAEDKKK